MSSDIFTMIGHSPAMRDLEQQYFDAICWSALPTALVAVFSGFFTGLGVTRTVMWINAVGLVVNVIFDYLFISGRLDSCHGHCRSRLAATVLRTGPAPSWCLSL